MSGHLTEETKFNLALNSMGAVGPASDPGVAADFPWDVIAKGKDGIVDVGAGQGTLCCSLAAKSIIFELDNSIQFY